MEHIIHFLIDLKFNNNRPWFHENKDKYDKAKKDFEELIRQVIESLGKKDNEISGLKPKDCIFRIFRDVRFSKNSEPYKTNFGAFISPGGRKGEMAGYYLHLEPDNSFLGGGIYMPQPEALKKLRTYIFEHPDGLKKIIKEKRFVDTFSEMWEEKLKTAPKGFPKDFEDIELLKYKHYVVTHKIENEFWNSPDLIKRIVEVFDVQRNFNNFLNKPFI